MFRIYILVALLAAATLCRGETNAGNAISSASVLLSTWATYVIGIARYVRKCSPLTNIFTPLRTASCGFRTISIVVKSSVTVLVSMNEISIISRELNQQQVTNKGLDLVIAEYKNANFTIVSSSQNNNETYWKRSVKLQPPTNFALFKTLELDLLVNANQSIILVSTTLVPSSQQLTNILCNKSSSNSKQKCSITCTVSTDYRFLSSKSFYKLSKKSFWFEIADSISKAKVQGGKIEYTTARSHIGTNKRYTPLNITVSLNTQT